MAGERSVGAVAGEPGFAGEAKLFIPFPAEALDQRFAQGLVEAYAEASPVGHGGAADFPAMVVDGGEGGIGGEPQGVEVAGDGFAPVDAPPAVGSVDGAEAFASFGIAREGAVAPVDDGGDQVAFFVDVCHALPVYGFDGAGQEVWADDGQDFFEAGYLRLLEGGAGIAFDAACSEASVEVAAEEFFGQVEGYEGVLYLKHECVLVFGLGGGHCLE